MTTNTHVTDSSPATHATKTIYTDVIVVGAGPIGLSMCASLRDTGLKVHLIEKQSHATIANPQPDGREIAVTHRTKHLMQELDQWRRIDDKHTHFLRRAEVYNGRSAFALGFDVPKDMQNIDTLGYLLSNCRIRQSIYDVLQPELNKPTYLTAMFGRTIDNVTTNYNECSVTLTHDDASTSTTDSISKTTIQAKLILAADSRTSFMRKALGISADMHEFGRTVILFRCKHTLSNYQTAHEGFYYGKTLAVLPLGEYESSMVITIDNRKVDDIISLSDRDLAGEMMQWLDGSLGNMTVHSDRHLYPLLAVHADKFYGTRSALLGDSAVGMHPVTAHGYNLGMESVELMSALIGKALRKNQDIGNPSLLKSYHRKHSFKTRPLYHGTNSIVKLYTDERPPAKVLRHIGLRAGDAFLPIKKIITSQLTG